MNNCEEETQETDRFSYLFAIHEISNSVIRSALDFSPGIYDDILATYGYLVEEVLILPVTDEPINQIDLMIALLQKIRNHLEKKLTNDH